MDERSPDPERPVVDWEAPTEPVGPAPGIEFAPRGPRIAAYLIDSLVLSIAAVTIVLIPILWAQGRIDAARVATESTSGDPLVGITIIVSFVVLLGLIFGYFPFFWARGGQTPGMRPFRLWVVRDADGTAVSWRTAVLRMIAMYFVSAVLYLGFVWVFIDKRRRSWHDLVAGTVVIRRA